MPGPGAHLVYALGSGVGLMHASDGRFSPQHCLIYAVNSFVGPDLGQLTKSVAVKILRLEPEFGYLARAFIHHPFYYVLLLGLPMALFYSWLSHLLVRKGYLDSGFGIGLTREQCLLLVAAGSLTHFFLDHLFEDDGQTSTYQWILSTGWWKEKARNEPAAVIVVGFLCICLIGGFIYINRVMPEKSVSSRSSKSARLILAIVFLYCIWCTSQLYWRDPPHPAIGEEADLGVLVFLFVYFFLPHSFCLFSMNPIDNYYIDSSEQLPLRNFTENSVARE